MRFAVATSALVLATLAGPAARGETFPPYPGRFASADNGPLLPGRIAVSWTRPLNAAHGMDDALNAQSWGGVELGGQWGFTCAQSSSEETVIDHRRNADSGTLVITTVFRGGSFFLSKDGPWSDGVSELHGAIDGVVRVITLDYVAGAMVGVREQFSCTGRIDGSRCAVRVRFADGVPGGNTDVGERPSGYPEFLDTTCGASRTYGSWGDTQDIVLDIDCVIATQPTAWGSVKSIYR